MTANTTTTETRAEILARLSEKHNVPESASIYRQQVQATQRLESLQQQMHSIDRDFQQRSRELREQLKQIQAALTWCSEQAGQQDFDVDELCDLDHELQQQLDALPRQREQAQRDCQHHIRCCEQDIQVLAWRSTVQQVRKQLA